MKSSPPQAQYAFFFPSRLCWLCESLHFLMGGLCLSVKTVLSQISVTVC